MEVHVDKLLAGAGPKSVRLERACVRIQGRDHYVASFNGISIAVTRSERDQLLACGVAWEAEDA